MIESDEKKKYFIQAKTLKKFHANRNENKNLKKKFSLLLEH